MNFIQHIRSYALFVVLLLCGTPAYAQSASTDVLPKGTHYLEFDLNSHLERHQDGGYQTYASRLVVGVKKRLEVGLNMELSHPIVPDQGIELQPNIKWQYYHNESKGTAASVGAIAFVPIFKRAGTDTFGLTYANFSKQLRGDFAPRFTVGAYAVVGRERGYGSRVGAILGYAQPLHRKVSFGLDWWSGSNDRMGYVTPSLTFAVSKRSQLTIGYGLGNCGRKNNELVMAYGITF